MRIRATNNVAKLTNVMKLVASSKLRAVEEALNRGRAFGVSAGATRGVGMRATQRRRWGAAFGQLLPASACGGDGA
jgi:hypothetical protein